MSEHLNTSNQGELISEEEVFELMNDEQLIEYIVSSRETILNSDSLAEIDEARRKSRIATQVFDRKHPYVGPAN